MACLGFDFTSVFHVKKFSFCFITWKVCPSKIGFSDNGEKTEFPGVENLSFPPEFSSPLPKEAIHFIYYC